MNAAIRHKVEVEASARLANADVVKRARLSHRAYRLALVAQHNCHPLEVAELLAYVGARAPSLATELIKLIRLAGYEGDVK